MKTKRSDIGGGLRAELLKHERLGGIPGLRGNGGTWHAPSVWCTWGNG